MVDELLELGFGPFRLNASRRSLTNGASVVEIGGRALDILIILTTAAGATIGKNELLDRVWPGMTVEENNLHVQISALRKLLGKEWITTVPGRGYRFTGTIRTTQSTGGTIATSSRPMIAVLPFDNFSTDPKWDRFCDGLVEDITTALATHRDLSVIARYSSFSYKGKPTDVREIGRQLGARYLLEGSIQADPERIRVTAQLIDATTGAHVWAGRLEREPSGLFDLQDEIVDHVIAALAGLNGSISRAERARIRRKPPASLDVYEQYLLAYEWEARLDRDGTLASIDLLKQTVATDPNFSRAWTVLAWAYGNAIVYRWVDDLDATRALWHAAIREAARSDPNDALALVALVGMHGREGNQALAEVALSQAWDRGAYQADVLPYLARYLCTVVDRPEDAMTAMERGIVLTPIAPFWHFLLYCRAAYFSRQFERAIEYHARLLADPATIGTPMRGTTLFNTLALAQLGRSAEVAASSAALYSMDAELGIIVAEAINLNPAARCLYIDGLSKAGLRGDWAAKLGGGT